MTRQRSTKTILTTTASRDTEHRHPEEVTPEARLLSLLGTTQSTLAVESAGRVAYINLARSFLRSGPAGRWLEYLMQQKLLAIVWAYWLSNALFLALPFCNKSSVRTLALVCAHLALAAPAHLCSVASLNADIVRLLLREPEFRFVTLFNAVNWGAVAAAFSDVRALSCCSMWLATQIAFTVDANTRALERVLNSSPVLAGSVLVLLAYSFADTLGESNSRILLTGKRRISLHDLLVNTAPTLTLFLAKLMYHQRGRLHSRQQLPGTKAMYCSIYQKRLTLQPVQQQPSVFRRQAKVVPRVIAHLGIPLLRSHRVMSHVNTMDTVLFAPQKFADSSSRLAWIALLCSVGTWGFVGVLYSTISAQVHAVEPTGAHHPAIPYSALAATAIYCGVFVGMFQRDLVLALAQTFDVAFSSLQFTVLCLCLCDAMRWDIRCVNLLTWWIWFHWMLFLDALTPPVRAVLRFVKYPTSAVALLLIYGYLAVFGLLYHYGDSVHLYDRAWVASPHVARLPPLRTGSVLAGRLATLLFWNMRLLWDFGVRPDSELVFLRDLAEYYTPSASCAQLLGLTSLTPRRLFFGPRASTVAVSPAKPRSNGDDVRGSSSAPDSKSSSASNELVASDEGEHRQSSASRVFKSGQLDVPARIEEEEDEVLQDI